MMREEHEYGHGINTDLHGLGSGSGTKPERLFGLLTQEIIGAAFEVHRELGPGFLEKVYASALLVELRVKGRTVVSEAPLEVMYKGSPVGLYFADLLVEGNVLCELKAVRRLLPEHEAQLLHYLKATGVRVGLLPNFGTPSVQVKRLVF